jgi:mannose-6-phosphate isomerase-like protein (cupin superfamily)
MGDFTHKNLRDVQDAAVAGGFSEVMGARFASGDLETTQVGVCLQAVHPGKRQAFAHRHENAEEVYVILRGAGRMKLDDEIIEIGELDAVRVAPTVARSLEAGEEGLELLVFGQRHEGDGEMLGADEFWGGQ